MSSEPMSSESISRERATSRIEAALVAELGPELLGLLQERRVTNIHANPDGSVYVRDGEGEHRLDLFLDAERRAALMSSFAGVMGTVVSARQPHLAGRLEPWNVRLEGWVPPVAPSPFFVMRLLPQVRWTLDRLIEVGTIDAERAEWLARRVLGRSNVIIAGAPDSGKTSFAQALLGRCLDAQPSLRLVTIEEGALELQIDGPNVLAMQTVDEEVEPPVTARTLLRSSLRLNPRKVVIGEARGPEAYEWLRSASTGLHGSVLTIHAPSGPGVFDRLADLVAEAGVVPNLRRIVETVDVVVHLVYDESTAKRRVDAIFEVNGLDAGGVPVLEAISTKATHRK